MAALCLDATAIPYNCPASCSPAVDYVKTVTELKAGLGNLTYTLVRLKSR